MCDDGNAADGDGCTMDCQIEEGFTCTGKRNIKEISFHKYDLYQARSRQ